MCCSRGLDAALPEERGHDGVPDPLDSCLEQLSHEEFRATRHEFESEIVTYADGVEREIYRCQACNQISLFRGNPEECPVRRERYDASETKSNGRRASGRWDCASNRPADQTGPQRGR